MAGSSPWQGFKRYLLHLLAVVVFPVLWLRSLRFARRSRDDDPRAVPKVAVAILASILIAAGGAYALKDYHDGAESNMYVALDTRLADAVGESDYQAALDGLDGNLNTLGVAIKNLNQTVGDAAGNVTEAQKTRAKALHEEAVAIQEQIQAEDGLLAEGRTTEDVDGSASALLDRLARLLAIEQELERLAVQASANVSIQERADIVGAAVDVVAQAQADLAAFARAAAEDAAAAAPDDAQGIGPYARDAATLLLLATQADQNASVVPTAAGLQRAHDSFNASRETLRDLMPHDVPPSREALEAQVAALDAAADEVTASFDLLRATAAADAFAASFTDVHGQYTRNVGNMTAFAGHHGLYLDLQPEVAAKHDAGIRDLVASSGVQQEGMHEATERALAIKDDAYADMMRVYVWFLIPCLIGAFFAPIVFALGSILHQSFEPSDTVGFKPYPSQAMGWFLLLGGFGPPSVLFAAWAVKDMHDRRAEGQISL